MSPIKKPCAEAGCPELIDRGSRCKDHERERAKAYDEKRGSFRKRGYTPRWDRISRSYRKAHPLCEDCLEEGETTPADLVHHIVPLAQGGPLDDWNNLRSLCQPHHNGHHHGV